ncbi:MAG: tRNA (guanosine(37)-N1)-methyltransferase TrmD [Solobacterium sp.]|nr:tRNA (guanosine(37)-N1)-methyltransferase TrmD [Solobacterium sp.]
MKISILTLFPEQFEGFFSSSIIGRSVEKGIVTSELVQIRDFSTDNHRHVDDTPFGGGAGMVMKCQPVLDALASIKEESSHVVLLSASGTPYTQRHAHTLTAYEHLILICGHYEGVDQRIVSHCDEEISIGDYVLTGGELGAMVIADSVIRLLPGVIRSASTDEESYEHGLLEYPQYTQPAEYEGEAVPEVLLSGHHENIRKWRLTQSLLKTRAVRPDLFQAHELTKEEEKLLRAADEM